MSDAVISVEHLSKHYRLGTIGGRTLREDLARAWARLRGQPEPLGKIGQEHHGNHHGETIWALRDVSFEVKQGEVVGIIRARCSRSSRVSPSKNLGGRV